MTEKQKVNLNQDNLNNGRFHMKKPWRPKGRGSAFFKQKQRTVNPESYIQEKYFQE
jgi:hypothetical protein